LEAATHAVSTSYEVGDVLVPSAANDHWYMVVAKTTGSSGAVAPVFPTNGGTVVDSGITLRDMGLIEYVAGTDYELDGDYGIVNIPSTGAIAVAAARIPASMRADGKTFRLSSDYTRARKISSEIAADSTKGARKCRYRYYTQNPKGGDEVWFAPKATLTPSGDWSQKTGSDYSGLDFVVTCEKPPASESLYINDKPA
jgi:hypothetical protein